MLRGVLETYTVRVLDEDQSDSDFKDCIREEWRQGEMLHRSGGLPAVTIRSKSTGEEIQREFWENGKQHRLNGPAIERLDEIRRSEWWVDGKQHRIGAPAVIEVYVPTGIVTAEQWYREGVSFREGCAPTMILRNYLTGITNYEFWETDGHCTRWDGPVEINRDEDTGIIVGEVWQVEGKTHRDGGPAFIRRCGETGQVLEAEYYQHGVQIAPSGAPTPNP